MNALFAWASGILYPPSNVIDSETMQVPRGSERDDHAYVLVDRNDLKKYVSELAVRVSKFEELTAIEPVAGGLGMYEKQGELDDSMVKRKMGYDLICCMINLNEDVEGLIERVKKISKRLVQIEVDLVENSQASGGSKEIEGVNVVPGVSLIDPMLKKRDVEILKELVSDFETVAYGTRSLFDQNNAKFPRANYFDNSFQVTNYSSDSLAISMRNRNYGYQLIQALLNAGLEERVEQVESALDCMVKYETLVNATDQRFYGDLFFVQGFQIKPGVSLQKICSSKRVVAIDLEKYRVLVPSDRLRKYLAAHKIRA